MAGFGVRTVGEKPFLIDLRVAYDTGDFRPDEIREELANAIASAYLELEKREGVEKRAKTD